MIITFVTGGVRTTTQDDGRHGYTHLGIPISGALDIPAMRFANHLVGNALDTPVLELTANGPLLRCDQAGFIALTGANFGMSINGNKAPSDQRVLVNTGDEISFSSPSEGYRGYLALEGLWQVPKWLGSASALRVGSHDLLPGAVWTSGETLITLPRRVNPWPTNCHEPGPISKLVNTFQGPEFHWLSPEAQSALFASPLTVCEPSNRVGLRTDTALTLKERYRGQELRSSGVMPGTVQVTQRGQAIVLLADGQTIGGYPRILQCSPSSMRALGQLRVGDAFELRLLPTPTL